MIARSKVQVQLHARRRVSARMYTMYAFVFVIILAVMGIVANTTSTSRNSDGIYEMHKLLLLTNKNSSSSSTIDIDKNMDINILMEASRENDCLKDVLNNLPIVAKQHRRHPKGLVRAHHYDAHNLLKWNADSRLDPFPPLPQSHCTIWEVGAHKHAADSRAMLHKYSQCHFHAFEPVPAYYAVLQKRWKDESRMTTHNYGMANQATTLHLSPEALAGQSTFVQDAQQNNKNPSTTIPLQIVAFETAFEDSGGYPTVLHMNCEGCEWDFLPQAASWLNNVLVIQIGFHAYPYEALGERGLQYCQIRQLLSRTHDLQPNAVPFGWERWVRKNSTSTKITAT